MAEQIVFRGELVGHGGWVTSIATTAADPNTILTSSRDKVSRNLNWNLEIHFILIIANFQTFELAIRRLSSSGP